MIQDPTDQYIAAILSRCDILGKELLEIGCGRGRITRDLARHAARVVATDPDAAALACAWAAIASTNVEFLHVPTGVPDLPGESFDVAIYTLSLHHVPVAEMSASLHKTARMLREEGIIVVIEPGDGGSLTEAKERFGAGSGDERYVREAARRALHSLEGWTAGESVRFRALFQFTDEDDFFRNLLPSCRQEPEATVAEVRTFLERHRTASGIILDAGRRLDVLYR
jgi:ubiquinone/menaquinone biosynthesis C-methylase UbiE